MLDSGFLMLVAKSRLGVPASRISHPESSKSATSFGFIAPDSYFCVPFQKKGAISTILTEKTWII